MKNDTLFIPQRYYLTFEKSLKFFNLEYYNDIVTKIVSNSVASKANILLKVIGFATCYNDVIPNRILNSITKML